MKNAQNSRSSTTYPGVPPKRSLASVHPSIAQEWDYSKNGEVSPDEVTPKANKKFWWCCPQGHSYQSRVCHRVDGSRCPYCAGKKALAGFNDLESQHPEVASQWDDERNGALLPSDVTPKSAKKVWWWCPRGHSYDMPVYRKVNSAGCPYCSGRRVLTGFNDLESQHPELASQWDAEKNEKSPQQVSAGSNSSAWWTCKEGHSWKAVIRKRSKEGQGCPYCSGRRAIPGENDLLTTHPDIASQWDSEKNPTPITEVKAGSNTPAWWRCDEGHSWKSSPNNRKNGRGCPYCSGRKVQKGFNDVATTHPHLAQQWSPENSLISIEDVSAGSHVKPLWVCENGHQWAATVNDRARGHGCPAYATRSSHPERDLATYVSSILLDGTEVILGDRSIIAPKELDIYVPSRRIAIEFNGLHWHSEESGKDRLYHYDKWRSCQEKGIQLITVWEDQWRDRQEVVKSMLSHKLGASTSRCVYARKTIVEPLGYQEASTFHDAHHIQGSATGSVHIGLRDHNGNLVALSTWRKLKDCLYLDRYCTSCIVIGGMGKLLKAGRRWGKEHGCTHIATFSDHEVSDGGLYQKLGFTRDKELKPDYRYVVDENRVHKFNYRLKRFRSDPNLEYQEGLSERELALLNGIPRVWDCGKTRWVMEL